MNTTQRLSLALWIATVVAFACAIVAQLTIGWFAPFVLVVVSIALAAAAIITSVRGRNAPASAAVRD